MKINLDSNIIIEFQANDMSSFDEFYEKTKTSVFYNILSILKDYDLSEDALQETYIRFLENIQKIDPKKDPLNYLFKISKNVSLDLIKKRKRVTSLNDYQESIISTKDNYLENEIFEKMKTILKDNEFKIVIMHVVNEMTHKEIAKLLNKPLGTITWAYNNAMKKLEKGLKGYER